MVLRLITRDNGGLLEKGKPMPAWDWQLLLALLCVAVAVMLLMRRGLRFFRGRNAGGCYGCPSNGSNSSSPRQREFVSIDTLKSLPAEHGQEASKDRH
jgi:hypothetical protein